MVDWYPDRSYTHASTHGTPIPSTGLRECAIHSHQNNEPAELRTRGLRNMKSRATVLRKLEEVEALCEDVEERKQDVREIPDGSTAQRKVLMSFSSDEHTVRGCDDQ